MSLIDALFGWLGESNDEKPLCPPPVAGERIEFDEDEQEWIDIESRI